MSEQKRGKLQPKLFSSGVVSVHSLDGDIEHAFPCSNHSSVVAVVSVRGSRFLSWIQLNAPNKPRFVKLCLLDDNVIKSVRNIHCVVYPVVSEASDLECQLHIVAQVRVMEVTTVGERRRMPVTSSMNPLKTWIRDFIIYKAGYTNSHAESSQLIQTVGSSWSKHSHEDLAATTTTTSTTTANTSGSMFDADVFDWSCCCLTDDNQHRMNSVVGPVQHYSMQLDSFLSVLHPSRSQEDLVSSHGSRTKMRIQPFQYVKAVFFPEQHVVGSEDTIVYPVFELKMDGKKSEQVVHARCHENVACVIYESQQQQQCWILLRHLGGTGWINLNERVVDKDRETKLSRQPVKELLLVPVPQSEDVWLVRVYTNQIVWTRLIVSAAAFQKPAIKQDRVPLSIHHLHSLFQHQHPSLPMVSTSAPGFLYQSLCMATGYLFLQDTESIPPSQTKQQMNQLWTHWARQMMKNIPIHSIQKDPRWVIQPKKDKENKDKDVKTEEKKEKTEKTEETEPEEDEEQQDTILEAMGDIIWNEHFWNLCDVDTDTVMEYFQDQNLPWLVQLLNQFLLFPQNEFTAWPSLIKGSLMNKLDLSRWLLEQSSVQQIFILFNTLHFFPLPLPNTVISIQDLSSLRRSRAATSTSTTTATAATDSFPSMLHKIIDLAAYVVLKAHKTQAEDEKTSENENRIAMRFWHQDKQMIHLGPMGLDDFLSHVCHLVKWLFFYHLRQLFQNNQTSSEYVDLFSMLASDAQMHAVQPKFSLPFAHETRLPYLIIPLKLVKRHVMNVLAVPEFLIGPDIPKAMTSVVYDLSRKLTGSTWNASAWQSQQEWETYFLQFTNGTMKDSAFHFSADDWIQLETQYWDVAMNWISQWILSAVKEKEEEKDQDVEMTDVKPEPEPELGPSQKKKKSEKKPKKEKKEKKAKSGKDEKQLVLVPNLSSHAMTQSDSIRPQVYASFPYQWKQLVPNFMYCSGQMFQCLAMNKSEQVICRAILSLKQDIRSDGSPYPLANISKPQYVFDESNPSSTGANADAKQQSQDDWWQQTVDEKEQIRLRQLYCGTQMIKQLLSNDPLLLNNPSDRAAYPSQMPPFPVLKHYLVTCNYLVLIRNSLSAKVSETGLPPDTVPSLLLALYLTTRDYIRGNLGQFTALDKKLPDVLKRPLAPLDEKLPALESMDIQEQPPSESNKPDVDVEMSQGNDEPIHQESKKRKRESSTASPSPSLSVSSPLSSSQTPVSIDRWIQRGVFFHHSFEQEYEFKGSLHKWFQTDIVGRATLDTHASVDKKTQNREMLVNVLVPYHLNGVFLHCALALAMEIMLDNTKQQPDLQYWMRIFYSRYGLGFFNMAKEHQEQQPGWEAHETAQLYALETQQMDILHDLFPEEMKSVVDVSIPRAKKLKSNPTSKSIFKAVQTIIQLELDKFKLMEKRDGDFYDMYPVPGKNSNELQTRAAKAVRPLQALLDWIQTPEPVDLPALPYGQYVDPTVGGLKSMLIYLYHVRLQLSLIKRKQWVAFMSAKATKDKEDQSMFLKIQQWEKDIFLLAQDWLVETIVLENKGDERMPTPKADMLMQWLFQFQSNLDLEHVDKIPCQTLMSLCMETSKTGILGASQTRFRDWWQNIHLVYQEKTGHTMNWVWQLIPTDEQLRLLWPDQEMVKLLCSGAVLNQYIVEQSTLKVQRSDTDWHLYFAIPGNNNDIRRRINIILRHAFGYFEEKKEEAEEEDMYVQIKPEPTSESIKQEEKNPFVKREVKQVKESKPPKKEPKDELMGPSPILEDAREVSMEHRSWLRFRTSELWSRNVVSKTTVKEDTKDKEKEKDTTRLQTSSGSGSGSGKQPKTKELVQETMEIKRNRGRPQKIHKTEEQSTSGPARNADFRVLAGFNRQPYESPLIQDEFEIHQKLPKEQTLYGFMLGCMVLYQLRFQGNHSRSFDQWLSFLGNIMGTSELDTRPRDARTALTRNVKRSQLFPEGQVALKYYYRLLPMYIRVEEILSDSRRLSQGQLNQNEQRRHLWSNIVCQILWCIWQKDKGKTMRKSYYDTMTAYVNSKTQFMAVLKKRKQAEQQQELEKELDKDQELAKTDYLALFDSELLDLRDKERKLQKIKDDRETKSGKSKERTKAHQQLLVKIGKKEQQITAFKEWKAIQKRIQWLRTQGEKVASVSDVTDKMFDNAKIQIQQLHAVARVKETIFRPKKKSAAAKNQETESKLKSIRKPNTAFSYLLPSRDEKEHVKQNKAYAKKKKEQEKIAKKEQRAKEKKEKKEQKEREKQEKEKTKKSKKIKKNKKNDDDEQEQEKDQDVVMKEANKERKEKSGKDEKEIVEEKEEKKQEGFDEEEELDLEDEPQSERSRIIALYFGKDYEMVLQMAQQQHTIPDFVATSKRDYWPRGFSFPIWEALSSCVDRCLLRHPLFGKWILNNDALLHIDSYQYEPRDNDPHPNRSTVSFSYMAQLTLEQKRELEQDLQQCRISTTTTTTASISGPSSSSSFVPPSYAILS